MNHPSPDQTLKLTFLGTGAAWGLPELSCDCLICRDMRRKREKRERSALLLSGPSTLLLDCGPDIKGQLARHGVDRPDAVLISHEHGDHYLGLDELFAYKRVAPRGTFEPIPVYLTPKSWETISVRFGYLEEMGVISPHLVEPGRWFEAARFNVFPFKTDHGRFASGSVGFLVKTKNVSSRPLRLVYTSDLVDLPEFPAEIKRPDYLVIQAFWLNEPAKNTPRHMSFQRALEFIRRFDPERETFLIHMGDADQVPGDPANAMTKKYEPLDPLRPPSGGKPYPIPRNQAQWQETVERILTDRGLARRVTVAFDGLEVNL
ncbi:MAG: MBL fold metallo-hydrolase [Deltaproteobacteria bacterium]|nr:MBL fold metallo-hydrolase [Deltaproteobacteria bacterium]MBW1922302.1 MBL fold metallo-hydrolase [Deltaproteobacteria bacterium]MBW1949112.1 MBL fold metallo-hydrolase [Deltaproteobacteria bacterium]MBW2347632.1 MBL fold metallo-hydrolase [Deltaproteobacteria bacterium]